jgi:hypothetical protein
VIKLLVIPTGFNLTDKKVLPLNFMHLRNPVPVSVYYDARSKDCWGKQSHCGTITDDIHRPQLSMRHDIWKKLMPDDDFCGIPLVVDPPIVLSRLKSTLAEPTLVASHSPLTDDPPKPGSHVSAAYTNPTVAEVDTASYSAGEERIRSTSPAVPIIISTNEKSSAMGSISVSLRQIWLLTSCGWVFF